VKAKDLLAVLPERQLTRLFLEYGGELQARSIAKAVADQRRRHPITTTSQLADLVSRIKRGRHSHLHPATKVFQALRIAVNDELGSIERALPAAYNVLEPAGKIVTISFHEGEDRIVKHTFRNWQKQNWGSDLTEHVVTPAEEELAENPRARSAKLRAFVKNK
jgi:16S rRNA (cytosine1402-N4)-methyltransferase